MMPVTAADHPVDCRAAVERLWAYLDNELTARTMADIDAHLEACAECRSHFAFARRLLAEIRRERAEPGDVEALRSRVLRSLSAEGFRKAAS